MKKLIIASTIIILIAGLFLGSFMIFSYYKKAKKIQNDLDYAQEVNRELAEKNSDLSQKSTKIDIIYNGRTGELFPIFPDDTIPSVCIWTMWEWESGSIGIVVTRAGGDGLFYDYNENKGVVYYAYDYNYNSSDGSLTFDKNSGNFIGFTKYDWLGHLLNNDIEIIKLNKFLPPRAPIYVTCVDSQNKNYYGSIGEYE